ncbi:hypothetical protein OMW55_04490 [Sphingomonas sp. BN140010]|uniref:Uncharacterized protein n=2 Tax=Sphingomonas arvum TaxID=2992113 RepID=A0ABT3JDA2_9SPHN|nr:hypothetical protein [Sphingomonas sp. BN140010]
MMKTVKLALTEDELEILADALENDLEGYVESAKDARANRAREDVQTFEEAAARIRSVLEKVRAEIPA